MLSRPRCYRQPGMRHIHSTPALDDCTQRSLFERANSSGSIAEDGVDVVHQRGVVGHFLAHELNIVLLLELREASACVGWLTSIFMALSIELHLHAQALNASCFLSRKPAARSPGLLALDLARRIPGLLTFNPLPRVPHVRIICTVESRAYMGC